MTAKPGDAARTQLARRSGRTSGGPAADLATRTFTIEDLMAAGGRGLAEAAARQGNASARRAIEDLARTVRQLNADPDLGGDAA